MYQRVPNAAIGLERVSSNSSEKTPTDSSRALNCQ